MKRGSALLWKYRIIVLLIVWLVYIINYFDRLAVLVFLPNIQTDLNLTPVQVGYAASVFFFAYAIAQVVSGFLADKFGSKKIMTFSIIVFTAITFLTGTVKNFTQFIVLRLGLGYGEGHHYTPASRTINHWFPLKERGRAIAFFTGSSAVAPALAPIILTFLSASFFDGQWRPIFYLLAIPGMIGLFALWYFVSDSPKEMLDKGRLRAEEYEIIVQDSTQEVGDRRKSNRLFLKDAYFYVYAGILFLHCMVLWGLTSWLTTFLVKQHGMDLKQMGLFASAPYIIAIFSVFLGGWLMDKVFLRMKPVALISYLGCVPVLWLLGTVEKGNTGILLTLLLLSGFFVNMNLGSIIASAQNRYPKEVVGSVVGMVNGIGQMGSFVSPLIAGYLVEVGANGSQYFGKVFVFFAICAAAAAMLSLFLKEGQIKTDQGASGKEALPDHLSPMDMAVKQ
ncbi:MFS transporter [Brevibacillus sp. NRS-1366]|uniref:MFS transporter n=1 Tax=Brevibacillus sp. NRS-1366 TaxID=3233899 RepID=UPI003D1DCE72